MKVVFLVCDIELVKAGTDTFRSRAGPTYREGIASIAACLVQKGIEVSRLRLSSGISNDQFIDLFDRTSADCQVAAFTSSTLDFHEASRLSLLIKKHHPGIVTICGGVHPTLAPEESINNKGFDVICRGEGEYPMLELCAKLQTDEDYSEIHNLWVKKNGNVIKNPIRPLISDLAELPAPLRDIATIDNFDSNALTDDVVFFISRGCPYGCTYCSNRTISKLYPNTSAYYRNKSIDKCIAEIKSALKGNPELRLIHFYDDTAMGKQHWFEEFCYRYKQEIDLPTWFTGRWETLHDKNIQLLKTIRCKHLVIGVESGDENLRRELLKRNQSDQLMIERAEALSKAKLTFSTFTMVGLPTETPAAALKTVKLTARLGGTTENHHSIFYPFIGTPLYQTCVSDKLIEDRYIPSFWLDTALNMKTFSREEILFAHRNFHRFRFYYSIIFRLPRPFGQLLERLLDRHWLRGASSDRYRKCILRTVESGEFIYFNFFERSSIAILNKFRRRDKSSGG